MTTTLSGSLQNPELRQQWLDLTGSCTESTPFHTIEFLSALSAAIGANPTLSLCLIDDVAIAGAVLFSRRRAGVLKEIYLPPLTPYSAVAFRDALDRATTDSAKKWMLSLVARHSNIGRLHLAPFQPTLEASSDWTQTARLTYVGELDRQIEVTANWSSNPKRVLKKNMNRYEVSIDNTASHIVARLNANSYERHGRRPLVPIDRQERLVGAMVDCGLADIFTATNTSTGEVDAAATILADDRSAYYWIVGSTPGPAMTVLIHQVLMHYSNVGLTSFDWVGANTPSIADFKRRFGPSLVEYQTLQLVRPTWLRSIVERRSRSAS